MTFWWILGSGLVMSAIALIGSVSLILPERTLARVLPPMVALAAGSMLGGALFHMIPESVSAFDNDIAVYLWIGIGFVSFLVLEQILHWHHCHRTVSEHREPVGVLILVADGVHNLIGGLAVGGAFVADVELGVAAWIAAAAHEVPQELGDFGVLIASGWRTRLALLYNLLSGLAFPVGGMIAFALRARPEVALLLPLAAGNFLYIAAVDLVPRIGKRERLSASLGSVAVFCAGAAVLLVFQLVRHHG